MRIYEGRQAREAAGLLEMAIRAGVIGTGYLGRHHARIYASLEGVQLVGVADLDIEAATEVGALYGARAYADPQDLIPECDVLSIVTPTVTHHAIAMDCLRAGKDILVEKPFTATVAEAEELVAQAASGGRIVQVGHLERFNPAVVEMGRYVKNPRFIESERVSPMPGRSLDVDVTLDLMIHDIDIVMSFLPGRGIKDVKVVGSKVLTDKIDAAKAWVEFEGGVSALITASRISRGRSRKLKVHQPGEYLELDYLEMRILRHFVRDGQVAMETVRIEPAESLLLELRDFMDCVKTRRRPLVSGEEGLRALRAVIAITDKIKDMDG